MINRAFLAGNLTADPTLHVTSSGLQVLEFGLAVNDRRKNQQTGQYEERPNFFSCKIFANRAEALSRILTKGMHISIEGHLQWSSWEDRDTGAKRSKIEVIVDELELMTQRQNNGYQQASRAPQMPAQAYQTPQNAPQMPQGYANPPQQQMAPQMPSQAPVAPQGYGYQQQAPVQQELYSEDIPFASPYDL